MSDSISKTFVNPKETATRSARATLGSFGPGRAKSRVSPFTVRSATLLPVTVRDRIREAFCAWQRTDRNRRLDTLMKILEAEFTRVPAPDTVAGVMSEIRRQGWERVPAAERRERMRALAKRPRPSRHKRTMGAA